MPLMKGIIKSPLTPVAQQLHLSPTLQINELVHEQQEQGRSIVHLGFGEATFPIQQDIMRTHVDASRNTKYLPVAGLHKLRTSIARYQSRRLGVNLSAEQVVVAPGSKPLLFALFDILQGDVLLPRPSWVSYSPQVTHAGKSLYWVESDEQDRHTIHEASLQDAFDKAVQAGANPKMLLINTPSNPTGQAFSSTNLNQINEFCRKHDIILISDEIYSDICFRSDDNLSAGSGQDYQSSQIILTGGLSKTFSAGGWRIGFAVFPENGFGKTVQKAILAYASECWSAASSPAQEAAAVAFEPSPEMDQYRNRVTCLHRSCTLRLYSALREIGLDVPEPKGAFYVYPSFGPYTTELLKLRIETSMQLAQWLIEECGIAALPGSAFGEDDHGILGGRYRLRMATSGLYFRDEKDRYSRGYALLEEGESAEEDAAVDLPLLEEAVTSLRAAVNKLKALAT